MQHSLAVSVWSLQRLTLTLGTPLNDLMGIIAGMGVDQIEINEEYLRLAPYDTPHGHRLLCKAAAENGVKIASLWFYTDLIGASVLTSVDAVADQLKDYLAIAALVGSPRITIPIGEGPSDLSYERGYGILTDVFAKTLPVADDYGVDIGLEVGRTIGRYQTPEGALKLIADLCSTRLKVVPDFEAWRHETSDLPLTHVESMSLPTEPASIDLFRRCLPHASLIHAKLLRLDETGSEPHFPLDELMRAVRESEKDHILDIEFEGWIPDIDPDRDCIVETRRCVALLKAHLSAGTKPSH